MKIPPETVTAGLLIPEGPLALSDGSVLLIEVAAGRLDGAAIGPDGIVYVWNKTAAASAAPAAAFSRPTASASHKTHAPLLDPHPHRAAVVLLDPCVRRPGGLPLAFEA